MHSEQVGSTTMYLGHILEVLATLEANSVQACVTSPPYFNLRRYQGVAPVLWGGDPTCTHHYQDADPVDGATCNKCGGWSGCLGLEPTVAQFIQNLVTIFREVRRVLRPDGICWINLGDSYTGSGKGAAGKTGLQPRAWLDGGGGTKGTGDPTLPRKNTQLVPFKLAIALQADGWIVRSVLPWIKRSAMPESIQDRPTVAHEYWLMGVKQPRYYYDPQAIRRNGGANFRTTDPYLESLESHIAYLQDELAYFVQMRDSGGTLADADGDLLALDESPSGTPEHHFATYNEKIVTPFLRVSTPEAGVCRACGSPWVRLVAPTEEYAAHLGKDWADDAQDAQEGRGHSVSDQRRTKRGTALTAEYETSGWAPSCTCDVPETRPAIVLDPFSGTGTTQIVAHKLGLASLYIDQSPEYYRLATQRLRSLPPATLEGQAKAERLRQQSLFVLAPPVESEAPTRDSAV